MSENTAQVQKKQSKKDTKKVEQWADTKDPFVNQFYKKLRNNQKRLNDIAELESKIKAGDIQPNADQKEKIARKDKIRAEMDDSLAILKIYQECFPDNLAFAKEGAKKKVEEPVAAAVDVSQTVESTLALVADAIALGSLAAYGESLPNGNQQVSDALSFVYGAASKLTEGAGIAAARSNFVDVFSRLALRS